MHCKWVEARLSAYVDGELVPHERLMVRRHVADCVLCAQELSDAESLKRLLSGLEAPEPDAEFEDRLMRAVRAQTKPVPSRRPLVAFVSALAVGVIAAAVFLQHSQAPRPSAIAERESSIAFEVLRDQVYSHSTDPGLGSPVLVGLTHETP
jgi:anti-sigma factor RsiW